jgi:hypothetical protein
MPHVLTEDSVVKCTHGAQVQFHASQTKLKVDGKAVIVESDILAATVSGCPNTDTQAGQTPCLKVESIIAGTSTHLRVDDQPVMLETARGLTNATPPEPVMWRVESAGQTKLAAG